MSIIKWDEYGYPTEESLEELEKLINSSNYKEAVSAFYEALEENYYPDAVGVEEKEVRGHVIEVWAYHTFGWSGNEAIIKTLAKSFLFVLFLERYDAGGHYYFKLKEEALKI